MPARRDGLLAASLLCGAALAGLYLLESRVAERHWFSAFLAFAPQQPFLLPSLLLFGIAALRRNARAALVNAVALLFAAFTVLGLRLPKPVPPANGPSLSVITWNVEHGSRGTEAITALLRTHRPDVICLQEVNASADGPDPGATITAGLSGYHVARHGELLTASRYPIIRTTVHPMDIAGSSRVALETSLVADGRNVTVWNLHFATASSVSRRPGGTPFQRFIRQWADAGQTRLHQADTLLRWTGGANGPDLLPEECTS